MAHASRRAGAGPYREARLTPPARPSAPAVATGFGGAVAAVATVARLLFERSAPPAEAHSRYIERASSLAGGARVMAVFADRDARHPEVLRVPGEPQRRGGDTVVAPDVLAGNGAVAALPDGEHLRDARSELLRAQGGVVRPLPGVEVAPIVARDAPLIERAGDFARLDDGEVVAVRGPYADRVVLHPSRARATALGAAGGLLCVALESGRVWCANATHDGRDVPNLSGIGEGLDWVDVPPLAARDVAQVVVAVDVVCARRVGGEVACARLSPAPSLIAFALPVETVAAPGRPPGATAIALGGGDLCLLTPDRQLYCLYGPQQDPPGPLAVTPIRLHPAMDRVDEVGLTDGVGCARRGGRVECWGPLARGGWVTQRERPVRIDGLRDVTSIAPNLGVVCALTGGDVWCWGAVGDNIAFASPERVLRGGATRFECEGARCGCARTSGGQSVCWPPVDHDATTWPAPPPGRAGELVRNGDLTCIAERDGRVTCSRSLTWRRDPPVGRAPVAGLDDIVQVVIADGGLACALRRDGSVWCWGDNRSGALTAGEAARSPRVVALTR